MGECRSGILDGQEEVEGMGSRGSYGDVGRRLVIAE